MQARPIIFLFCALALAGVVGLVAQVQTLPNDIGASYPIINSNFTWLNLNKITGPGSATLNHIPQFSDTTGKALKDGLSVATTVGSPGLDTNVPTEKAVRSAIIAAAGASVIAHGSQDLSGVGTVTAGTCAAALTNAAASVVVGDTVTASFKGDPTGVVGFEPGAMLAVIPFVPNPAGASVNFRVCNNAASDLAPGSIAVNWQVLR